MKTNQRPNDYIELREQLGDYGSVFYGPHACWGCGVVIVKKAREQGGDEFTLPREPESKYLPHQCFADAISSVDAKWAALLECPNGEVAVIQAAQRSAVVYALRRFLVGESEIDANQKQPSGVPGRDPSEPISGDAL